MCIYVHSNISTDMVVPIQVSSLEEEVRDLKERNTSMLLSLTSLRGECDQLCYLCCVVDK